MRKNNLWDIIQYVIMGIFGVVFLVGAIYFYSLSMHLQTKIIFTPIVLYVVAVSGILFARITGNMDIEKFFGNVANWAFIIFYFILVGNVTIENFTTGANIGFHIYTSIFWIGGIILFYSIIIKPKR